MSNFDLSIFDAPEKLCSIRHYCFVRGIVGQHPDPDFRQAFRTVNRLYVELRHELKGHRSVGKRPATRRKEAA